ncbi:hypothetical protein BJX61DRAFT_202413 [Aspergillus egyptiacus]|nr:hypothetical protein BJX61DRAFT_202413 [Aspergillus egyptiacus]
MCACTPCVHRPSAESLMGKRFGSRHAGRTEKLTGWNPDWRLLVNTQLTRAEVGKEVFIHQALTLDLRKPSAHFCRTESACRARAVKDPHPTASVLCPNATYDSRMGNFPVSVCFVGQVRGARCKGRSDWLQAMHLPIYHFLIRVFAKQACCSGHSMVTCRIWLSHTQP